MAAAARRRSHSLEQGREKERFISIKIIDSRLNFREIEHWTAWAQVSSLLVPLLRINSEYVSFPHVALRTCRVSCSDLNGIEHTVEVTADSLFEAVALS
jgi:hypothetical protein